MPGSIRRKVTWSKEVADMRKAAAILVAAALLASMAPAKANAGGGHGAGAFFAGIIGGTILGAALSNAYSYPVPVYGPPPRAYYPPEQVWVPGRYETRLERQWVPGHWEIERYGRNHDDYDDDDGGRPGYQARRIWVPGHYEPVEVRVW